VLSILRLDENVFVDFLSFSIKTLRSKIKVCHNSFLPRHSSGGNEIYQLALTILNKINMYISILKIETVVRIGGITVHEQTGVK
jgi:hypothetical protein